MGTTLQTEILKKLTIVGLPTGHEVFYVLPWLSCYEWKITFPKFIHAGTENYEFDSIKDQSYFSNSK